MREKGRKKEEERREGRNSDITVCTSYLPPHTACRWCDRVSRVCESAHVCPETYPCSTAITRTSWYRLMRPVKERGKDMHDGFEVSVVHRLSYILSSPQDLPSSYIFLHPPPPPPVCFASLSHLPCYLLPPGGVHTHAHTHTQLRGRFKVWKVCMSQVLKEKCMDGVSKQTQLNVSTNIPQLTSSPKNGRKLESIA